MKKLISVIIIVVLVLIIGVIFMSKPNPTKIPYNNGFYSGPYNPKLPIINPKSK